MFSLDPKVDDDGVTFRSTYDGSSHRLTPEIAVHTQELLGADIQMVLDVCPPLPSPPEVIRRGCSARTSWSTCAGEAAETQTITFTISTVTTMITVAIASAERARIDGWIRSGRRRDR